MRGGEERQVSAITPANIVIPDSIGVYTLKTGMRVIPGESRGPRHARAIWTPAFAGDHSLA